MRIKNWQDWGIQPRIVLVSVLPVVFLFFSVIFYSYHSRLQEVQLELEDRGRIVALSLASSSEYGVLSENMDELRHMLADLLRIDKSIFRIQIRNVNNKILVEVVNNNLKAEDAREFEAEIINKLIHIDPVSETGIPATDSKNALSTSPKPPALGYVKVALSPSIMLTKKKEQILVGSLIATIALLVSTILGLYLSLSMTRPLSATIDTLREIRRGNYEVNMKLNGGGELGELQGTIMEMSQNLKQSKEELESKVIARTLDLEEARNQAIKAHVENRRLIQKVNS
ncbi:MAG TPA: HAMP domain-containing protein, partial [Pirellula sp.]|nr:HAMP domain-containing protein [Pirellula sp.]